MDIKVIPGAGDQLGWGFNIFGKYGDTSKLRQLLDLEKEGFIDEWVNGVPYRVPRTVALGSHHGFSGTATFCKTTVDVAKFFQAKADVHGSYGAFSGAVSAAYSDRSQSDNSHTYCIFDAEVDAFGLQIENPEPRLLADSVTSDPVYKAVLSFVENGVWNDDAKHACFRFFGRFGTHFIHRVRMGGSLYYYAAISKSFTSDASDIEVKASAEYHGLFLSAGATAEADWKKAGKDWVENRTARVIGVGGNTGPLDAVDPGYGTNHHNEFVSWSDDVKANPSPIGFALMKIMTLFPQDANGILNKAYEEYVSGTIVADVSYEGASVTVNEQTIKFPELAQIRFNLYDPPHLYSYVAHVVDRATGMVVDSVAVDGPSGSEFHDKGDTKYKTLPDTLAHYPHDENYVLIFLWASTYDEYGIVPNTGVGENLAPAGDLYDFLLAAGASRGWYVDKGGNYEVKSHGCYALVGTIGMGEGTGVEAFTDITFDIISGHLSLQPSLPSVSLTVPFIPQEVGGRYLYTPTTF